MNNIINIEYIFKMCRIILTLQNIGYGMLYSYKSVEISVYFSVDKKDNDSGDFIDL